MNNYRVVGNYKGPGAYCIIIDHDIYVIYIEKGKNHISMTQLVANTINITGCWLRVEKTQAIITFGSGAIAATNKDKAEIIAACSEWLNLPVSHKDITKKSHITINAEKLRDE